MDQESTQLEIKRWPQTVRLEWSREQCDDSDASPLEYMNEQEDAERLADWRSGGWRFIGIRAKASLFVPIGSDSFACYSLTSPGLWAIESDSSPDYLAEVYAEEKAQLRAALAAIGEAVNHGGSLIIETEG